MLSSDTIIHDRYRIIYVVDERPGSTVYRGRDEQSGRLVLVAALGHQGGSLADIALLARQAAATSHEALLPIVDHFEDGATYYIICDDIGGQDLERTLRARGGPLPEAATLTQARRILDALEYLHRQKPPLHLGDPLAGDVWIGEDGAWHIAPFTLIRPIGHAPSAYRARELDRPTSEPNAASDLYALSAMLYQALTGWAPPTAAQREEGTPLKGPRALNPNLSLLVEQVLLRGLQLKPENRYQVTREMRQSLEMVDIMDGRSLGLGADALPGAQPFAGPPAPTGQPATQPTAVAPPAQTGGYASPPVQPASPAQPAPAYLPQPGMYSAPPAAPVAAAPIGYAPAQGQPYPAGTYQAQPPRRGISTGCLVVAAIVLTLAAVTICAALAWFVPGSPLPSLLGVRSDVAPAQTTAPASAASAAPSNDAAAASPIPAGLGERAITLANASQITQTREITGVVLGPVAYSPDGKTLAVGISNLIDLRDAETLDEVEPPRRLAGHAGQVFVLAWSPDSKLLASGSIDDAVVRLWNASDGRQVRQFEGHTDWIRGVVFSPDGKTLATGSFDKTVRLWDVASGTLLHAFSGHTDFISSVVFTPDGKSLASSSSDGSVRLWDTTTGQQRSSFTFESQINLSNSQNIWVTGLAFSPDGKTLAAGQADGTVAILDAATGAQQRSLIGHTDIVVSRAVQFSPDGKTLATGSFDGTVRLWDMASGTQKAELRGHGLRVLSIAFSADGQYLSSTSDEGGQMLVWDVQQASVLNSLHVGQGLITSILFSQDGSALGMVGYNGTARLQLLSQDRFRTLLGASSANKSLAFLSEGRVVSITDQNTLTMIVQNESQAKELTGLDGRPLNVVTSANSQLIVAGSSTGAIGLWDGSGAAKSPIRSGFKVAYALAVSSNGELVAVGGPPDDARIEVWDTASAKLRQTFESTNASITNLAFQPGGDLLAATDLQGELRIWNARDGKLLKQITATPEQQWFSALTFSPDGSMLVTGSPNGDTVFRNAQTGEIAATLAGRATGIGVYALAFSPDGQLLAFGLSDQSVRLFTLK
jgi:WD40 repeat protein